MSSPKHLPSETHKPIIGYLWGVLAVFAYPCRLPILAIVLAGIMADAFAGKYRGVAALTLTGLFVLSATRLLRVFRGGSWPFSNQPKVGSSELRYQSGGVPP